MSGRLRWLAVALLVGAACSAAPVALPPPAPSSPPPTSPIPSPSPDTQVPNVVGLSFDAAKKALVDGGLTVKRHDQYSTSGAVGTVLSQSVDPGSFVPVGSVVRLNVAKAIPPPVNGNPYGFNWGCCTRIYSPPSDFCSLFVCTKTFYIGTGYVVQCKDEQFSLTGGTGKGTCKSHDGYQRTLYAP